MFTDLFVFHGCEFPECLSHHRAWSWCDVRLCRWRLKTASQSKHEEKSGVRGHYIVTWGVTNSFPLPRVACNGEKKTKGSTLWRQDSSKQHWKTVTTVFRVWSVNIISPLTAPATWHLTRHTCPQRWASGSRGHSQHAALNVGHIYSRECWLHSTSSICPL